MEVLIVDHNEQGRAKVIRSLSHSDFSIRTYESDSIERGLQYMQNQKFNAVLIDCDIPTCNGFDLFRLLNKDKSEQIGSAMVMMGEHYDESKVINCIRAGAHDFIPKSELDPGRLQRIVTQALMKFELQQQTWVGYQKIKNIAEHDSLTGLPNRYFLEQKLKRMVETIDATSESIDLVHFDIDRFKLVNDTYGHDLGDTFLIEFCRRIQKKLPADYTLVRVGGDDFSIVHAGKRSEQHVKEIIKSITTSVNQTFVHDELELHLSVSIGVAEYPKNCGSAAELVKNAEIAMYKSKKLGRNKHCCFEPEMYHKFSKKLVIENQVRTAIRSNGLELHYQPSICSVTEKIAGVEALIRMKNSDGTLLFPDYFIEIAEESGLIIPLGKWVIKEACRQLSEWQQQGVGCFEMAINVSPTQLLDPTLPDYISSVLQHYSIEPKNIELELTETALLIETTQVIESIQQMSDLGCRVALDDFGTGFSSISHLQMFPIDTVKIDRSLMPTDKTEHKSIALMTGLANMIKALNLSLVAEGVESEENSILCRSLGIERIQGYYYSKPIKSVELHEKFLSAEIGLVSSK